MENALHYIELSKDPITFDSVSQLTNVFFDDSNRQIFAVRSGGATGIVVKGPTNNNVISFCMDNKDKEIIRSIKFAPDNKILAVQRVENSVEFIPFQDNQPLLNEIVVYTAKSLTIFGFVWVHDREIAIISSSGVEIFLVAIDKKQVKSMKSITLTIKWFAWCPEGNFAVLATNNGMTLNPVILKQKTITRLPKLDLETPREGPVPERDVTLGQIYGTFAVLILLQNSSGLGEIVIYMLNGPGLAPRKQHVLRLGHSGRFAMNIVDNLIVVHHQASATSLLFDIALSGEVDTNGITYHAPITPGRAIKPFLLKVPSLGEQTKYCELYSKHWVLFQPNIVIDASVGRMWYLYLQMEPLCTLITDRVRLVEFLLNRTNGKRILLNVLQETVDSQYNGMLLPIMENVFDKLNVVYSNWLSAQLQSQTAQPSSAKNLPKLPTPPKVLIDQNDMYAEVFTPIAERAYTEKILILYLQSLARHNIDAQPDLSKMIAAELIRNEHFDALQKLVDYALLKDSKLLACFLLSHSQINSTITQTAMDILDRLKAYELILEILLSQGKVIDALRVAKSLPDCDTISARKYLEAAKKTGDPAIFYSVFLYFQQRNYRLRGSPEFIRGDQCLEFVQYFSMIFGLKQSS